VSEQEIIDGITIAADFIKAIEQLIRENNDEPLKPQMPMD
jgi:hypothetical protein